MPHRSANRLAVVLFTGLLLALTAGCLRSQDDDTASDGANVVPEAQVTRQVEAARNRLSQNEGGRLVLRAIEAHGGLAAWYRAPTSSYTWEYANVGIDMQFKSFLVADNQTRHVYHDLLTVGPYEDPQPVNARFAWNGEIAWMQPDSIERPNPHFWATTGYYFEQIPFILADPGLTYERLPDETLDGTAYEMVKVGYAEGVGYSDDDTYTLYVHPESGQVDAIRYTVTYGRDVPADANLAETLFEYDDYVTVDGLTVATHFRGYEYTGTGRGDFRNEAWADSISFRRPFDAAQLAPPEGARIVEPPPVDA
jgi:hypothetical protein